MNKKTKVANKKHHRKVKKLKAKTRARREAASKAKTAQA